MVFTVTARTKLIYDDEDEDDDGRKSDNVANIGR